MSKTIFSDDKLLISVHTGPEVTDRPSRVRVTIYGRETRQTAGGGLEMGMAEWTTLCRAVSEVGIDPRQAPEVPEA